MSHSQGMGQRDSKPCTWLQGSCLELLFYPASLIPAGFVFFLLHSKHVVSLWVLDMSNSSHRINLPCHKSLHFPKCPMYPYPPQSSLPFQSKPVFHKIVDMFLLRSITFHQDVCIFNKEFIYDYGIKLGWFVGMGLKKRFPH